MNQINKIKINDLPWNPFRENADIKNLINKDLKIDLIKLAPNASFAEHSHKTTEWSYIVDGEYSDAFGTYTEGDFVINEKGSSHTTKSGTEGCVVLVIKNTN